MESACKRKITYLADAKQAHQTSPGKRRKGGNIIRRENIITIGNRSIEEQQRNTIVVQY